jgi:uracil-DNA glycosylase
MLRIEFQPEEGIGTFTMQGRLAGSFANYAKDLVLRSIAPSTIVVDLSDLTFVDDEGEEVLQLLNRLGVCFEARNCYAQNVCERLQLRRFQPKNKGLRGTRSSGKKSTRGSYVD